MVNHAAQSGGIPLAEPMKNPTKPFLHDINMTRPDRFFVFVVGICDEWDDGRDKIGDEALVNEYLAAGVPKNQIAYVKDSEATKKRCQSELEKFLKRTTKGSTLVFYYGGHGVAIGFCTHKAKWRYRTVVECIEANFSGDRVIVLADCCASGNFCQWLQPPNTINHEYLCIMSVVPFTPAGEPWTLTESWIRAMQCNNGYLTLSCLIDFLSDEIAREKGDVMAVFLSKEVHMESSTWLPKCSVSPSIHPLRWQRLPHSIPYDAKVDRHCSIGDLVYVKYPGGPCPVEPSLYIAPVWLQGTIQAKLAWGRVRLQIQNSTTLHQWQVDVSRRNLLNELYMGSNWMVSNAFFDVECKLAQYGKYLDCSMPVGTSIQAPRKDGPTEQASIADWKEFDWDKYLASEDCNNSPPLGPYAVVRWEKHKGMAVVPAETMESNVTEVNEKHLVDTNEDSQPRNVLIKSIQSFGRTVQDAKVIFRTSELSCYWPEEEIWYDADALDLSTVSLDVLASHAMFKQSGIYCPVLYDDGESYLIPLCYIRERPSCRLLTDFFNRWSDR